MESKLLDLTAGEYHADLVSDVPCFSASIATILCNDTPLHAWTAHPKLNPNWTPEDSKVTDIGRIAHALLLEGMAVAEVIEADDWRKNETKAKRDAARESGKIPILAKDYPAIEAMVRAAHIQLEQHAEAKNAFTGGKPEQTIVWDEDGVRCKARIDWLHDSYRFIDDYKTAASANPEAFTRQMFGYGYDIQAALYVRAVRAATGKDATFRFIVQEKELPHALCVVSPGPDVLMLAEKKIQFALDLWRKCLESGEWPAYPTRICWAELPPYEETRWLKREENSVVHI